MTAKEAMQIIKSKYTDMSVIECLDFPDFFAFGLTVKGAEGEDVGGGYFTVAKNSGKLGEFTPMQDFEAFLTAKQIDINTLN